MRTFKLWAGGDAHVGTDLARANRRSLADAILQAEQGGTDGGPPFEWDIMLDIGDLSGSQTPPDDEEGEEVVRQYSASTKHPREDFYNIVGNHDASGPDEPCQWWFRKWVDPTGEHSEYSGVHADRRPYPIEGTWERYSFDEHVVHWAQHQNRISANVSSQASLSSFKFSKEKRTNTRKVKRYEPLPNECLY